MAKTRASAKRRAPAKRGKKSAGSLVPSSGNGGWYPLIREPFAGAWQRNLEARAESVLTFHTVFACVSLISSDIAKMRLVMRQIDADGIWNEVTAFAPFFRKPNHWQNRIEFFKQWVTSKLVHGNTYVLKERDEQGRVARLYILDPMRVQPLVAPDGQVFYQLGSDDLSGIHAGIVVPAKEIIHDKMECLYHPLVGVSPIAACALGVAQGLFIQRHAAKFFRNGATPGGTLTAPGNIKEETAKKLEQWWNDNYAGPDNAGKVVVLGDGLKYEAMAMKATDAQLVEQLKLTSEMAAVAFKVPLYKVGAGQVPTNNNVEALDQQYYSQCLQIHIEQIELCLHEGFGLPPDMDVHFDTDDLLRMDTATQIKTLREGAQGGLIAPNEGRLKLNLKPVPGGEMPYMQEQNWPLSMLADRQLPGDAPTAPAEPPEPAPSAEETAKAVVALLRRDAPPPAEDDEAPAEELAAEVDRLLEAA